MNTKHTELLNIQNSADEIHKQNSPLIEREQIPNSPFWIIGDKENGYNLIMGKWKLTQEPIAEKEHVTLWIRQNRWNLILSMIICVTQDIHDQNTKEIHKEPQIIDPITRKIK